MVYRSAYHNNLGTIKCSNDISPPRLVLWSGLDAGSVVLFDSGRGGPIPFEGVISEGPAVRVQFITDQPNHNTGFNIRYEGKSTHISSYFRTFLSNLLSALSFPSPVSLSLSLCSV